MKVQIIKYPTVEDWLLVKKCTLVTVGKETDKPATELSRFVLSSRANWFPCVSETAVSAMRCFLAGEVPMKLIWNRPGRRLRSMLTRSSKWR